MFDRLKWIFAVSDGNDATHNFCPPFIQSAATQSRPALYVRYVAHIHGYVVTRHYNSLFYISERFDKADTANHVFDAIYFNSACSDVAIGHAHCIEYLLDRDAV